MPLQIPDRQRISGLVFNEPLSEATESRRKALLFTASFSVLLTVYGVTVTKTPWLDIDVPTGAPDILQGAMAVALVYTFIVFSLYALADLRRWFVGADLLNLNSYFDLLLKTHNSAYAMEQWLEKGMPDEAAKRAAVEKLFSESRIFAEELRSEISKVKRGYRKLSVIQWLRLALVDLGIPLSLGMFAIYKIGPSLGPFLEVIVK